MPYHLRWLLRRDMPEVLAIERASFEFPWREADFIFHLRHTATIAHVALEYPPDDSATAPDRVFGFMVYELLPRSIHLLNIAVCPTTRRRAVGRALLDKLAAKLSPQRRVCLTADVREQNLAAQLFFRACGWRAVRVVAGLYDDTPEDAYRFEFPPPGLARQPLLTAPARERKIP